MIFNPIVLDSSFFKALLDHNDDFHHDARILLEELQKEKIPLCTTNFLLDETYTVLRIKTGLPSALDLKKRLSESLKSIEIIRVTVEDEVNAWDYFKKPWSKLSFTDCVTFALMKRMELTTVACFDDHYRKVGFKVRP